ncbi:ATP-binding cassette sub-family C member 10 [Condylostylus longicornis]|uniref:ATP-binding cassette sub-family C member 10 n=1 Tax=Condylostylus longicornis TaxID=2530218 RepID=UPI00244E3091|nr:ATP-binding cassette sub-family C member 10 [Condylostylus longicornis]XP_055387214.1 ATP-binding cassette sub-family C member 10 [Condylostylus longicornis]XP_055387215.1 ATP-binding cassette sub-family C member 10 [Condylostylus longicornis]XP_055387217.1 ATP-binding cassette sub-family C member 10 [Condylostylus longicornis]XP_055387218.1 ATP-binding cassette sub-family C member 10 [Condylostylus longicornis]XP_055387219.1 ATP-binding cassette sub-family C member 10 [Condylostylus longic
MNNIEIGETYQNGHFRWNWSEFCPTGLTPWQNTTNDLLPCFQEIVLQLPIYACFAIVSSFYCGAYAATVARNITQLKLIYSRIIISTILAIIPIAKSLYYVVNQIHLNPAEVLLTCTETIMWAVHIGYLFILRKHGGISHRGPLIINVFWTAIFVLHIIWLRTSFSYNFWNWSLTVFILDLCYLATFLISGSAVQVRSVLTQHEEEQSLLSNRYVHFGTNLHEASLGHAQDEANLASKFLFYWVEPLITKGSIGNLKKVDDLFDLPDCLNINRNSERLQTAVFQSNSFFWALHKAFGREFYLIGLLRFIADTAGFAGPLLLGGLLTEHTKKESIDMSYLYALGLLLFTSIGATCSVHFNWRISILGMKMRTGVVTTIYSKAIEARGLENATPEILNLMSTDTDRIVNSCISFHSFWSIPFQLLTTLYLLYTQVGAAFIAGVLFAASLIPINRLLANKIHNYSIGLMNAKDSRLSITRETIQSAKHIKINAWEDIFIKKIKDCRDEEMKFLSKRKYLDAICVYFWATTPVLMCLLTFGVSVLIGNPLTAATTYTSVALLNMLIGPLNAFPWVLNGLVEAWVSIKRIQELLNLENLDFSTYYDPLFQNKLQPDEKLLVLEIKDGTFEYDLRENQKTDHCFKLESINLQVKQGELVCIEGSVGSGKSTLISAIIAKMKFTNGSVAVQDLYTGFGYVPQLPWLQRGTIRENIIWGAVYDEQRYKKVVYSCALTEDLLSLGGDQVGIGENGHTLSGGQRMRISLARAVYQDKSIYLLDDILSSVDAHVANHIIKYCILGLLKHKTRIVITENSTLFLHANQILKMDNGELRKSDLMSDSFEMSEEDDLTSTLEELDRSSRLSSIDLDNLESDNKSVDSIMLEESKEQGYINTNVLIIYWNAMKGSLAFSVILFVVLMQISRNLSDIWLAKWVTDFNNVPENFSSDNSADMIRNVDNVFKENIQNNSTINSLGFYLGIYASLAVTNSLITLIRAFVFAFAGLRAAKFIHNTLLNRVLYTKFKFFDITSVGRILNRFSSDTYTIDDSLPFILNIFLAQVVGLAGAIFITLYAMPWLGLVIIPMVPIYYSLQYRYRYASRDIKRLSSNALSPIYTHFTETLQGLMTIRAMRASTRFQRDFHVKLEESIKAQLSSTAAQQWLAFRLQLLGSFLVGGAGLLATLTSAHYAYPSLVGLAISYSLSITGLLGGVLNAFAETEQEFVAVERVSQYLELEKEDNADGSIDPPFGWPSQGALQFNNVYFKYREHLTPALENFNLRTEAFERIAVVGRTGAGKTSILSALLRVAPLACGEIVLDCVNLKTLALHVLRDRIAVISQEPFLFEGTVRENLDPRKKFLDSELWNAITACLATPLVQSLGGLSGYLEKNGSNLSAGQKQLLCLTRALLKSSQIVCIDEGTSNLDTDSEAAIQIALKYSFRSSTVFLIAHRLKGLQNVDRIIVMDSGKIAEEGKPAELASNPNSLFSKMLQEQKNTDYVLCDSS